MKSVIISILLIFSISYFTGAQTRFLQGVVHTLDSIPLEGVNITVKSTGQAYLTDVSGIFLVECNPNDKLKIRADGFYNQSIRVNEKIKFAAVNLKMKPGNEQAKYAIGYGDVRESESSGAIAGLSYKDTDFTKYESVQEILRDNFAGVQVIGGQIQVRGSKTLTGDSSPLIVIDGVISEMGLSYVRPLDVKWINVLKDGTTAVYGSRGTNGVIVIETKKGGE